MLQPHHVLAHVAFQEFVDGIQDLGLGFGGHGGRWRVHRMTFSGKCGGKVGRTIGRRVAPCQAGPEVVAFLIKGL
jgi:hypothetical protein